MTQPEARLQRKIQNALRDRGTFVFKVHGSQFMMSGLPDLIVCKEGAFIGLEVKMPGNTPTPIQLLRKKQIEGAGGQYHVVHTVDEALFAVFGIMPSDES